MFDATEIPGLVVLEGETALPGGTPRSIAAATRHALNAFAETKALTLLVNDPQRHTDTRAVLEAILAHMDPSHLRIIIATGSHHYPQAQQKAFEAALLGDLQLEAVAWHDCRSEHLATIAGEWCGHRWLVENRPLLAIGSVEPHYFAGFTGAHKTATIGCAGYADIEHNHARALEAACRPCRLEDNPVYEGVSNMLWALMSVKPLAVVNLVQRSREVIAAFGGEPYATLTAAAAVARQAFVNEIPAPADAIVAEVSGPLGRSFYQADKGIKNNEWALRDGGCLVLVAPCSEGIGQDAFVDLLRAAPTYEQAADLVSLRGYKLGDHKAVRLRYLTDPHRRNVKVFLVSEGISDEQAQLLGMTKAATVREALGKASIDPVRDRAYYLSDAGNRCIMVAGS